MKEIKRLTRCEKGHFYDAGKYEVCPHCENTGLIPPTKWETDAQPLPSTDDFSELPQTPEKAVEGISPDLFVPVTDTEDLFEQAPAVSVSSVSAEAPDDSRTVHFYQKTLGTEPVVGWLVCISGVHFGQDFRLKSGRNFLGRGGTMDICLSGDSAVSRDRHMIVTYDPKGNSFFAQPGDTSSELSYLNDKPLLEATALQSGDKLTVGESELVFVPFCGESFTWKN